MAHHGVKRIWRKIVRCDIRRDESVTMTAYTYSWSSTDVHTLTLECGHTKVYRGHAAAPKHKALCKACSRGKPTVPVTVEPGVFDHTRNKPAPQDPIARALIDNACENAGA